MNFLELKENLFIIWKMICQLMIFFNLGLKINRDLLSAIELCLKHHIERSKTFKEFAQKRNY